MQLSNLRPSKSVLFIASLSAFLAGSAVAQNYDYLNDANVQTDAPKVFGAFPKIMASETQTGAGTAESWSKYDLIGAKSGIMSKVVAAQAINPDLEFHYSFHPRAYLGYRSSDPCDIAFGMPFNSTGAATTGCSVYAGHWLYQAGTRSTWGIDVAARAIRVTDASRFTVGSYVVIYNSGPGSFGNAEHVKITGIDTSLTPHRISLGPRGYKSTPRWHGPNSIVAEHERGSGGAAENWAYNISTAGPLDSNNRTIAQVMAAWVPNNMNRNSKGNALNVNVTGVFFDGDGYVLHAQKVDANNDLVIDNGILNNGDNVWGEGLEEFFRLLRIRLPNKQIVGGWRQMRGFTSLNGIQMENWLLAGDEFSPTPDYTGKGGIYSQLHNYNIHLNYHAPDQGYMEALSKVPTKLYPGTVKSGPNPTVPANNANFRLGFAAALLGDGHYGRQNSSMHPDPWYDEYAVDVTPGSPRFGHAIERNSQDESAIRTHKGWLGRPLGTRTRIYNSNTFKASASLISNGGFETGNTGWTYTNINTQIDTSIRLKGTNALKVLGHKNYTSNVGAATVRGPTYSMVKGRTYTLAFAARAASMREIYVQMDWSVHQGVYLVPNRWTRFVYTVTADKSGQFRPVFSVGREETPVWFDDVYVFEGDPTVFRRDFENGVVVVNATPNSKWVNLGEDFQRILGTGQDSINNGQTLSAFSIPAFDAAILVRPEGSSTPAPPPPPSGGSIMIGGRAWNDADSDGVQDAGESDFSALDVSLLDCSDTELSSTVTDSSGYYLFDNLPAGGYKVQLNLPADASLSPAWAGSNPNLDSHFPHATARTNCINLVDGNTRLSVDAGLIVSSLGLGTSTIGDRIWEDINKNGIQDSGEPGLAGFTVRIMDCSANIISTTVSNSAGNYSFTVAPGDYTMRFVRPSEYRFSPALQGSSRALDSNINPATGLSGCMTLGDQEVRGRFDVGFFRG